MGSCATVKDIESLAALKASVPKGTRVAAAVGASLAGAGDGWGAVAALDACRVQSQVSSTAFSNDNEVADALCALLVTDRPDGLWSTVVVDERRVTLGLAYSSAESVRLAVARRRGVYQSRKRGVWVKGETSGTPQDLLEIEVDCDRDAVVFVVKQHGGGYCHRQGLYSCTGPQRGVELVMHTLKQRLENAPEGSYSKRLFADPSLLKSKLVRRTNCSAA